MGINMRRPIVILLLLSYCNLAWAQSNPSLHPEAGNIDLPDLGNGDTGQPTKFCKDIWTLCGIWAYDWTYNPPGCCRSQGPHKSYVCRGPRHDLREWATGFANLHKTYCLPIRGSNGKVRSGSGFNSDMYDTPSPQDMYSGSSGSGTSALMNEEIVEQLTRIADALNRDKSRVK